MTARNPTTTETALVTAPVTSPPITSAAALTVHEQVVVTGDRASGITGMGNVTGGGTAIHLCAVG